MLDAIDLSTNPTFQTLFYGSPSGEQVAEFQAWLDANPNTWIRLYHGTGAEVPVLEKGLLPSSPRRARSIASSAGAVSLSVYPGVARMFGEMGWPGRPVVVYAVAARVRTLRPDLDQLRNKRMWAGMDLRGTLAESLVFGHGAWVKRAIPPFQVSLVSPPPGPGVTGTPDPDGDDNDEEAGYRRLPPKKLPRNWKTQYVAPCQGLNPDNRVVFDYRVSKGLGASGYNHDVAYFGFIGFMPPAKFLALAARLVSPDERSISGLPALASTQAWGPPTLYVSMDYMNIRGHEGRHRATLLQRSCPTTLMPVHFFLLSDFREYRARHIDRAILERIRNGLYDEGNRQSVNDEPCRKWVRGPLFNVVYVDGRVEEWPRSYPDPNYEFVTADELPVEVDVSDIQWDEE